MRSILLGLLALVVVAWCVSPARCEDRPKPLMKDFMGINAHTIQFAPKLYAPLCRLVRDYHGYTWDVKGDSGNATTFPLSLQSIGWKDAANAGVVPPHQGRVDWKKLYGSWQSAGWEIDVSVQFGDFTVDKWDDLAKDAYRYGKAFAEYFGPSGKNKLVTSVEIGNEPAGKKRFSPDDWKVLHENMARGVRDGDPKLTIVTCTAEAAAKTDGWSMPVRIFQDMPKLYDVINVHKYAQVRGWPDWKRVHPEEPEFGYLSKVQETIDWRDKHAKDKQVWITEFGYDASTQDPPADGGFKAWTDVTDTQQAQWIVRSYLCFSAMDLDRAYLYWFNDNDAPSTHASSGVTRGYKPKPSYYAMAHLYASLGDYRFTRAVRRDATAWVFEYTHGKDPSKRVWVAWSPTGRGASREITLDLPGTLTRSEVMPLTKSPPAKAKVTVAGDKTKLAITESPTYLWIE